MKLDSCEREKFCKLFLYASVFPYADSEHVLYAKSSSFTIVE